MSALGADRFYRNVKGDKPYLKQEQQEHKLSLQEALR